MRALLSIVAIAALAAAAPDRSEPRCNSLETACSDLYLAIECGTVDQCIPRWEKLSAPVGNDTELCATCKKMVQEARDNLLSNMTQTELREVLEGSCDDLIPIRPFNTICKKLMDTFQDELNDMLVSRMDPTQVCTVSGLCWKPDNSDMEQRASNIFLRKSAARTCNTCRSSVSKIVGIAKFADKGDVVRGFSNACRNAGYTRPKCDEFAQTYVAKFLHHIQNAPSEKTCQFFGRCDGMSRPMTVGPADTMECEFCEAMIHKVVVQFNNTSMKEQVKTVLENICKTTGSWAAECQQRIADDFDRAYDELISMLDPVNVCSLAGLCNSKQSLRTLPLTRLTPARPPAPGSTAMCTICQEVAKVVQKAVNANFTQNQLVNALDLVCDVLPVVSKGNCFDFVNKNVPQLIKMFNERFTVEHICSESFKLCPAVSELRAEFREDKCQICEKAVSWVASELNATSTEDDIIKLVQEVCDTDLFPPRVKSSCRNEIEAYGSLIIHLLVKRMDPGQICTEIRLCNAPRVVQQAAPAPGPMCDECLQIANKIVAAIKDDKTEQNIKNVLDQTCQSCPDQAGCKKFIDDNIDRLFELLRQDVTADQICQALRLCSARRPAVHQKVVAKSEICDQCLQITNYIVDAIKDDKTEQNIKNVLEKTCQNCPDYAACKQFIDVNLDDLFELLRKDVTAAQICQALRLCAAQTVIPAKTFVKTEICNKCLDVANRIVDAIKDDKTEQNIKNVLDQTCQSCPDQAGCKKFIDDNIDQLFELLRQDVTADQICKALRLCSAQLAVHKNVVPKAGICDQCLSIANYIVSAIENDRTEQNIKNVLDTACAICPDQAGCKQVIDANIDQLYDLLRKDVTAAQICAALRLCGAEVMIPKEIVAKVENCGVCSMIVDYIIDKLKGNSTDEAIIDTLEKVCKVLPVDQKECQNYVDVYGGYIVSLIEKNYAADAICAAIGLCKTPKPVIRTPKTICNECQQIAGYLVSAVNDNRSEENIKAVVEKVCEMIPMDVGQCQQFIDTNIDQLYQLLRNEVTVDHICQTLRLCGARVFPVPLRPKTKVRSCGLCSEVVDYLIGAIKDNSTDAQILDALERVCNVLPFDKTECQNVINVYGEYIIVMIQQDVAADVICQKIGFCAPPPPPPPRSSLTSSSCDLCQMISGFVISELKDNTTDAAIIEVLERGCSVLPIDKAQCRNVVDVYGSMIVNMIQNNLTPDEICGTLRLCAAPRPKGQSCELCETVAHFLVDELKDNKTDAAILEVLERVCKVLPVDKVSCQNTIDVYGKMIMDLIQQDASADQICAAIGLCSTRRVVEKAKGDFCNACKMIAGFLVDELKDNKTDAAILAALEKVCKVVPVDSVQCKNYIDVYGNMVIEMIENNLSPDQICSSIGYCTARTELGLTDNQACPLCEIVVHVVEAELQNNNTQKEIETALEKACSLLPQNEAQQCRNMVNVYTTYIIDMVESLATAEQICQTLGFCPTPPTPPKCEVCLFITNFVESELSDNRTESQILKLLDKACDVIPNMDVPQCKETINQFSDMIITLLLQSVPPRKICEEIKMCPLSKKPDTVPVVRVPLADGEQCTFCKWLVTWVDDKLDDNRTEAVIIDELDKACDLLTDAGKCKDMVNDYVDMIVKMLIQYADPQKICEAIKKCPPKQYRKVEPPCRYCRYVIDELRGDVQKTEAELKKKLDGICRVIPVDTSSCQAFVEQYAEQIINLILSDTDPEKICEILGVCPKKIRATDSKCDFCREVMQFVVDEVKDETTDDEIVGLVARACNYVPATHREDCQRMVEIEGLVIVRMIGESLDADSICGALKYCPEKRSPDNLTCTWCQYALHFIQEKLYDNSTQQMIQEALEKMCLDLPKPELSAECREFVDAYGPSLEVIIAQDLDPSVICPAIRACPARKALSKPARRTSSQKCHDCVSTLRSFRHNPAQICKGVSSQFATKCVGASSVGVQLANAFESDYKICQYAKSCSKVSGSFRCNRGGCQHIR